MVIAFANNQTRFKFTLSISGGTTAEVGAVTFDLHVLLDHT